MRWREGEMEGGREREREREELAYPSSIETSALASTDIEAIAKLLLSTRVDCISGLMLPTVKLMDTSFSFPTIPVTGFSATLSRMLPGPEKGFPMEHTCLDMPSGSLLSLIRSSGGSQPSDTCKHDDDVRLCQWGGHV